jgi:predicted GH43/DUF377 family glycosyl hydrolase
MKSVSVLFILVLLIAFTSSSIAQHIWEKYRKNPVLEKGSAGTWDDDNVIAPCVIKVGKTYHMWYDGNWDNIGSTLNGIGHATSSDGINWEKDEDNNPVLTANPANIWESLAITQVSVLFNNMDSLFHIWYAGYGPGEYDTGIGHATSSDGAYWTRDASSDPVLFGGSPGSWDDNALGSPCVIQVDGTYHMWYDGWGNLSISSLKQIGHAISADGINWEKDTNNPVLMPGSSASWDYNWVRGGNVVFEGSKYHMWYTGGAWCYYDIGYAFSTDGSNWTKYNDSTTTDQLYADSDPVMKKGELGSWDSWWIGMGSVMLDDTKSTFKMWYSGSDNDFINSRIGYANAMVTSIEENNFGHSPQEFVLNQNYPNPFNPRTIINYELPITNDVNLNIYNMLGQKVAILVSEKQSAGSHQVEWDATGFASGVYYYRIKVGEFQDVKKMILLR